MKLLLEANSLCTISSTVVLKVVLSIAQKAQFPIHFTLADLGALYNRANSPNPTPLSSTYNSIKYI